MATNRTPAPKGGVDDWRVYLEWLEDRKSKPGEFRGPLEDFEGSAERGSSPNQTLNACIAALPVFKDFELGEAKEAWKINHPWGMDEKIAEKFFAEDKNIKVLLTPHHLISCCVTEALTRHFKDVIENDIGYNVNSPDNLLILPNSTAMACYLGVPPHEGNHEFELSAVELASTKKILDTKIGQEKIWGKFKKVEKKGYHAKVLKLVHKVIVDHFKCKKHLDRKKFIADMNIVSKKILKKLDDFDWKLHKYGADYKPGNLRGCYNTRFISSYIEGPGEEKARARESAKGSLQNDPCASEREHIRDLKYFLYKDKGKDKLRKMGMKVASEVEWVMSASSSKRPAKKDKKQTETA